MSKWKVELYNPHLQDWRTKKLQAPDRGTAREQGLEGEAEGWEIDDIHPICSFCDATTDTPGEGSRRVVVIDPSDVEDEPPGTEAPTRVAWVCKKHHEVVQNLDIA
jgi:hypothetical protein